MRRRRESSDATSSAHSARTRRSGWVEGASFWPHSEQYGPERGAPQFKHASASERASAAALEAAFAELHAEQRRTALTLRLRSDDLGAALDSLGIEDVIARTNGRVAASLQWPGAPWSPSSRSICPWAAT